MSSPAVEAIEKLTSISHLPPSMNGSPWLYAASLTAMMCGVCLGLYVVLWMGRDLWRHRAAAHFKSVIFNFRLMMTCAGLSVFVGCIFEVLYLQMFGDPTISPASQALILMAKQASDSFRVFPIIGWVVLLVMIYPYITLGLMKREDDNSVVHSEVEDYPGLYRMVKPVICFICIALISMAFAFSKVYGG